MPIGFKPSCSNLDMKNIADQFFNSDMSANALRNLLSARNSNTDFSSTSTVNKEDAVEAINTSAVAKKNNIDNQSYNNSSRTYDELTKSSSDSRIGFNETGYIAKNDYAEISQSSENKNLIFGGRTVMVGSSFKGICKGKMTFSEENNLVFSGSSGSSGSEGMNIIIGSKLELQNYEGNITFAEKNTLVYRK